MKMNLLEAVKQGMACESYNFVPKKEIKQDVSDESLLVSLNHFYFYY